MDKKTELAIALGQTIYTNTINSLTEQRDLAIQMLAEWCVAVDEGGAGWDYWDRYYKEAMYGKNPIRELLDKAISEAREQDGR